MNIFSEVISDSQFPDELTKELLVRFSRKACFSAAQASKNAWHTIFLLLLERYIVENNATQLHNILILLYLNVDFFKNPSFNVLPKWILLLKKILKSTTISVAYRAVSYVILLLCLQHQDAPKTTEGFDNASREQTRTYREYSEILKFLAQYNPIFSNAIEGYYAFLHHDEERYQFCVNKHARLSRYEMTSANGACIVLRLFVANSTINSECQKYIDVLEKTKNNDDFEEAIHFIHAFYLCSSTNEMHTGIANALIAPIKNLLLTKSFDNSTGKEVSSIAAFVLMNVTWEKILDVLSVMYKGRNLCKGNERIVTLTLCKFILNYSFITSSKLTILKALFSILLVETDREKTVAALQHIFKSLSLEDLKYFWHEALNELLWYRSDYVFINEIFGVALSAQPNQHRLFLIEESLQMVPYEPGIESFVSELISSLPEEEQIKLLRLKLLPMLTAKELRSTAVRILARLSSKSVPVFDILPSNLQLMSTPFIKFFSSEDFLSNEFIVNDFFSSISFEIVMKSDNAPEQQYLKLGLLAAVLTHSKVKDSKTSEIIANILTTFSKPISLNLKQTNRTNSLSQNMLIFYNNQAANFLRLLYKYIDKHHVNTALWDQLYNIFPINDKGWNSALSLYELLLKLPVLEKEKTLEKLVVGLDNLLEFNKDYKPEENYKYSPSWEIIFQRNILVICFAYCFDPSLDPSSFLEKCYKFFSNDNLQIKSCAERVILLLSPVAPMPYRLRAMQEIQFTFQNCISLYALIASLDTESTTVALKKIKGIADRLSNFSKIFNALQNPIAKLQFIHDASSLYDKTNYHSHGFFELMKSVFEHYTFTESTDNLSNLVLKYLGDYPDAIRRRALECLQFFPNMSQLTEKFPIVYKLSCAGERDLKKAAFFLLARMVPYFSEDQLKELQILTGDDSDLFEPVASRFSQFNVHVLIEIGNSDASTLDKQKRAGQYVLEHLNLARTREAVLYIRQELSYHQKELGYLRNRPEIKLSTISLPKFFSSLSNNIQCIQDRVTESVEMWTRIMRKCNEYLKKFDVTLEPQEPSMPSDSSAGPYNIEFK